MTWVRKDDQMPIHRKVAPLTDAAYRLEDEAMCWASRNGTDGRIRAADLAQISKRGRARYAQELVDNHLWHVAGEGCASETCVESEENLGKDGWVIHDYLAYNPSADTVRHERKVRAERQARWREAQRGRRNSDALRNGGVDALRNAPVDAAPNPARPAPKEAGRRRPEQTADRSPAPHGGGGPGEKCTRHPGEWAHNCRACRSETLGAA